MAIYGHSCSCTCTHVHSCLFTLIFAFVSGISSRLHGIAAHCTNREAQVLVAQVQYVALREVVLVAQVQVMRIVRRVVEVVVQVEYVVVVVQMLKMEVVAQLVVEHAGLA